MKATNLQRGVFFVSEERVWNSPIYLCITEPFCFQDSCGKSACAAVTRRFPLGLMQPTSLGYSQNK